MLKIENGVENNFIDKSIVYRTMLRGGFGGVTLAIIFIKL